MRRTLGRLLFVGSLAACELGCAKWFHRPERYDPFARARQTPDGNERAASDYPQLVPPGSNDEVTQAGREFNPRSVVPERTQSPGTVSRLRPRQDDDSELDSTEPGPRIATRPATGNVMDHAPDYSWIQGKLEYSALGGGVWKVRYAPLSADDQYGGSMILESPPNVNQVKAGDVVYIEGRIIARSARGPLSNPIYRADHMSKAGE